MNWQRIALLLRFDLYYSLTRLKGWVFLFPFFLFWFVIFKWGIQEVAGLLQQQEGIMISSAKFGTDVALNLFIDHPPIVSLFYLSALYAIPFFAVLAAYDQFSTDFGSGFFRFLSARCKRIEIFLARFLSAFTLMAVAFLIVTAVCAALSIKNDGYPTTAVMLYSAQAYLTVLLYALAFIAYMSVISSMVSSTLAALFLGFFGYALIWFINLFTYFIQQDNIFAYVFASSLKESLFELDTSHFFMALAILPIYILVYAGLAFRIFNRRNF